MINWSEYQLENLNKANISNFLLTTCELLHVKRILEVGCSVGNNFSLLSDFECVGIDNNFQALELARQKYPFVKFYDFDAKKIELASNSFDLVFSRGLFIHLQEHEISQVMKEEYRLSKKWIINIEYYDTDEKKIPWNRGYLQKRDMAKRWSESGFNVVMDYDLPLIVDPENTRCTIIEKML